MRLLLSRARVWVKDDFLVRDVEVSGGVVQRVMPHNSHSGIDISSYDKVIDLSTGYLFPGLVDVHVHLREPGFSCKETIFSGTRAAAKGGFTDVCTMPNLDPAPDTPEHLEAQLRIIRRDAAIHVHPYGAVTMGRKGCGELAEFGAMAGKICGISDDGSGVQDEALALKAMERAAALGLVFAAHCEDDSELRSGGSVHEGIASRRHGVVGINSKSEWAMVKRDLRLAEMTGCKYHVCHISTKQSVALIREAKARGVDVTCETAPHYLILCDEDVLDEGRFKMNPPIRTAEDRAALIEGIMDGTIDMIATDHAPHTQAEKAKGLSGSAMGVVGIEASFALMYTHFVRTGLMGIGKLMELMAIAPRKRFGIAGGTISAGSPANLVAMDLEAKWRIEPERFVSMGQATPFVGAEVYGETMLTLVDGQIAYERK